MLATFSGLNPKGPYVSLEKEKQKFCVVLTYSIKRAREIRKFHVVVAQQRLRNVQKSVMHVQRCIFCQSKLILGLHVMTKAMCKLYWIASAPARKPYRIGYELWFWRVFCDEAPRRSLKGRVTYIGKMFILKRIDFRAASKWMWIEFAHVQLYAN